MLGYKSVTIFATALLLISCANQNQLDNGFTNAAIDNSNEIIGGTEVSNQAFARNIVALYNVKKGAICTASIIGPKLILTAAHCIGDDAKDMRVLFGTAIKTNPNVIVQQVVAQRVFPSWPQSARNDKDWGDIALVKMDKPIPSTYQVAEILGNTSYLSKNQTVVLSGYGVSDGNNNTGSGILRTTVTTILDAQFSNTEILLDQTKGHGACRGDSGGPAYVLVNGKYYLWGITSRTHNDDNYNCDNESIYTKLQAYSAWIFFTAAEMGK